uniref:Uncharacterized protein n=1 Tax=viral metagenome TaxID=1070528 RepID=A0A6H1ZAP4_9ZZZZ
MALKLIRIGSATDVFQYDDGAFPVAIHTEGPMQADTAPTNPNEVLRLSDVPASGNIVTAAANITDHAVVRGDGGAKGVQDSLVIIDDTGSISLPVLQTVDGVDISVHAATPTAHQDAPGLIATHTAIPAAHHAKYTDAEAVIAAKADGDIADAITKKHIQGTDIALGVLGTKNPPIDADKVIYRNSAAADVLVTSTWTQIKAFLKTYFDTLYIAVTGRYRYAAALADAGTINLPTITANWPAHGFIHCAHASTGVISESAEFEYGSTGEVQIIRGTANIEAGGATVGKISLGPAIDANPVVIRNNLGGGVSVNALITLWYN